MKDRIVKSVEEFSATDSRLLRAALDQDQTAWMNLVQNYGERVYLWVRQAGLQEIDAAEVVNQVFISVARALPEFRHEGKSGTFRKWLRTITQNAVTDWHRARQRQVCQAAGGTDNHELMQSQAMSSVAASTGGPKTVSAEEAAMDRVRQRTDPKVWRLFWLVTSEQMTAVEVAAECGVSRNVVYITKHRLAKEIRWELSRGAGQDKSSQSSGGGNGTNGRMP